jgi:hypothetical protein
MSYILEVITVNRKENLFWLSMLAKEGQTDLIKEYETWYAEFLQSYIDRGYFVDNKIEMTTDSAQNEHGHWLAIRRIGLFKEPPMASDFFQDLNEHSVIYRKMAKKWTAENDLTVEVNILNPNEEVAVKQSSCETGICGRKDGSTACPTGPLSCHDHSTFDPRASSVKEFHIPLQSFVKFKAK